MPDLQDTGGTPLTIGQMARAANVPTSTVRYRYYERIRLLKPEHRSNGNYRLYDDASLRRLRFIRAAQGIGFTLDDVRALVGAQGATPSCAEVQTLLGNRLGEIEAKLKDLRLVKRTLKRSLQQCRKTERRGGCQIIEQVTRS
jgi:MerR family mercuric resistance operon transcriptional regulator